MTGLKRSTSTSLAILILGAAWSPLAALAQPANDDCGAALAVPCGSSATVDNTGATVLATDPTFACRIGGAGQGTNSTWYTFVATITTATINTETSVVTDTLLQVHSGTCGALTVIGCDDDGGTGFLSTVSLVGLTVGNTYYIQVSNWDTSVVPGNVTVNVLCTPPPPPPANDDCGGAVAIACGGSATVDNTAATTAATDPVFACRVGGAAQGSRNTWYSFVAADTSARVDTEGSVVTDTMLHVMDGTCASLTIIGCDDDAGSGLLSLVDVYGLTVGNTYYIEAANWSSGTTPGNITVNITCPAPPPPGDPINDDCNSPIIIGALPYNDFRTNDLATADGPPGSCNTATAVTLQNSIWYQWTTGPCDSGMATLTVDAEYDILANVWTGSCIAGFVQVPDPFCEGDEPQPVVYSWSVSPNTTYVIQIGDWGTSEGGGPTLIDLTFAGAPCPGDADGDGDVDQDDLDLVLFNFGSSVPVGQDGDVDCDGDVDQDDLDLTLFYFGVVCP